MELSHIRFSTRNFRCQPPTSKIGITGERNLSLTIDLIPSTGRHDLWKRSFNYPQPIILGNPWSRISPWSKEKKRKSKRKKERSVKGNISFSRVVQAQHESIHLRGYLYKIASIAVVNIYRTRRGLSRHPRCEKAKKIRNEARDKGIRNFLLPSDLKPFRFRSLLLVPRIS